MLNIKLIPTEKERIEFKSIKERVDQQANGNEEIFDALLSSAVSNKKIRKSVVKLLRNEMVQSIQTPLTAPKRSFLLRKAEEREERSNRKRVEVLARFEGDHIKAAKYIFKKQVIKVAATVTSLVGVIFAAIMLSGKADDIPETEIKRNQRFLKHLEFVDEKEVKEKTAIVTPPPVELVKPESSAPKKSKAEKSPKPALPVTAANQKIREEQKPLEPDASSGFFSTGVKLDRPKKKEIAEKKEERKKSLTPPPDSEKARSTVKESEERVKD